MGVPCSKQSRKISMKEHAELKEPHVQQLERWTKDDVSTHEESRPNEKKNGSQRKKSVLSGNRKVMTVKPLKDSDSHLGGSVTSDERERQIQECQTQLSQKDDEIKNLLETVQTLTNEQDSYHFAHTAGWQERNTEIRELRSRLREKEKENEILLTRLSSVASAKLTNNNPNIADLSDDNRPTKLSEKFSELYDNEWTDAFMALETAAKELNLERIDNVEKEIIYGLLKIVTITYETCLIQAETDIEGLKAAYSQMIGGQLSAETEKQLHADRRKNHRAGITKMQPVVMKEIRNFITESWKLKEIPNPFEIVQIYLDKCLELCWLMVIQDPPVYMDCDIKVSKKNKKSLDKNFYKAYTKGGKKIAFVVWPVLFLHKGDGPVLSKGVAQGKGNHISKKEPLTGSHNSVKYEKSNKEITDHVFSRIPVTEHSAENNGSIIVDPVNKAENLGARTNTFIARREAFVHRDTEETPVFSDSCTTNTGTTKQFTRKRKKMSNKKGCKRPSNWVENVSLQPDIDGRGSQSTRTKNDHVGNVGYENNAMEFENVTLSEGTSIKSPELPEVPSSEDDSYRVFR